MLVCVPIEVPIHVRTLGHSPPQIPGPRTLVGIPPRPLDQPKIPCCVYPGASNSEEPLWSDRVVEIPLPFFVPCKPMLVLLNLVLL